MLKTEQLAETVREIQRLTAAYPLSQALERLFDEVEDARRGAEMVFAIIDEAIAEVEGCSFTRLSTQRRFLDELSSFKGLFLECCVIRAPSSIGRLFEVDLVPRLEGIADTVGELVSQDPKPLDRAGFREQTASLIGEVQNSEMQENPKRALLLSLSMIEQMVSVSETSVSDLEIRRKVCRVVANFAMEFALLDREFETLGDKIRRWASWGYKNSSEILSLTANASTVAGLLPAPK